MLPSNPIPAVCNYGSSATYCTCPTDEQIAAGVVPLDSLPAAWWNWMWSKTNQAVNCARSTVGTLISELNTVLIQAGVCACDVCTDQLYQAITNLRRIVGDSTYPGAVKSSPTPGQVSIDANGVMTANCVGNASQLTTSARTLVGAVNELKSTYDCCVSDINSALGGKAPTGHASSTTTYGVGSSTNYGHLKISDTYASTLSECSGVAASQCALAAVYSAMTGAGYTTLGSTAGCALGTAAAGTATTAARSDHVHPKPSRTDLGLGTAADCAATDFRASTWTPTCVACAGKVRRNAYTNAYLFTVALTNGCSTADGTDLYASGKCLLTFCSTTGVLSSAAFCGAVYGCACCAGRDGSGCSFGTAARCSDSAFRSCTWIPDEVRACSIPANCSLYRNVLIMDCASLQKSSTAYCYYCPAIKLCGSDGWFYICSECVYTSGGSHYYCRDAHISVMPPTTSSSRNIYFHAACANSGGTVTKQSAYICGTNGYYYGNVCGTASCATNAACLGGILASRYPHPQTYVQGYHKFVLLSCCNCVALMQYRYTGTGSVDSVQWRKIFGNALCAFGFSTIYQANWPVMGTDALSSTCEVAPVLSLYVQGYCYCTAVPVSALYCDTINCKMRKMNRAGETYDSEICPGARFTIHINY